MRGYYYLHPHARRASRWVTFLFDPKHVVCFGLNFPLNTAWRAACMHLVECDALWPWLGPRSAELQSPAVVERVASSSSTDTGEKTCLRCPLQDSDSCCPLGPGTAEHRQQLSYSNSLRAPRRAITAKRSEPQSVSHVGLGPMSLSLKVSSARGSDANYFEVRAEPSSRHLMPAGRGVWKGGSNC